MIAGLCLIAHIWQDQEQHPTPSGQVSLNTHCRRAAENTDLAHSPREHQWQRTLIHTPPHSNHTAGRTSVDRVAEPLPGRCKPNPMDRREENGVVM